MNHGEIASCDSIFHEAISTGLDLAIRIDKEPPLGEDAEPVPILKKAVETVRRPSLTATFRRVLHAVDVGFSGADLARARLAPRIWVAGHTACDP